MIHLLVIILIKTVYRIPFISEKLWIHFAFGYESVFQAYEDGVFFKEQTKENSSSHVCVQFGRKPNIITFFH